MTDTETFFTRIPTLTNAELLDYVRNSSKYKYEAIDLAVTELRKRGHKFTNDELSAIQDNICHLNIEKSSQAFPPGRLLKRFRTRHLKCIAVLILISGLFASMIIYFTAEPASLNPLGYDPLTIKKYVREMELYGGKLNVLATKFRQWFDGLWHGQPLAFLVSIISIVVSLLLWFIGSQQQTDNNAD